MGGVATGEFVEAIPAGSAAIGVVMGGAVVGMVPFPASVVVGVSCPAAMFDIGAA